MYGYGYSAYNRLAFLGGLDSSATAFFSATGITDPTIQGAIDTLCKDLKSAGIWDKTKAIYPFVGGTATTHKFNLKDPRDLDAAFRLSFLGGWTHSSTGATPNGTNGYANTFLTPSSVNTLNSNSFGNYSGSNLTETGADPVNMGALQSITQASTLIVKNITLSSRLNGTAISGVISNNKGFFTSSKTSSTTTKIYLNSTSLSSGISGGSLPTIPLFIGTLNLNGTAYTNGYVKNDFRFTFVSDGLTDTEVSNLYTAVQKFQTTLGRQI